MKKVRMTVYLEPKVYDDLRAYAGSRRQPLSIMAEAAVAAFVDPEQKEVATLRRLGKFEKQLDRLTRDSNISIEAFMVYIWLWLSANPPLPEAAAAAGKASATDRYDEFMETLGRRLAKSDRVANEIHGRKEA
jgi:predicted transcriptional regulator